METNTILRPISEGNIISEEGDYRTEEMYKNYEDRQPKSPLYNFSHYHLHYIRYLPNHQTFQSNASRCISPPLSPPCPLSLS